ncbi:hypothetical protein QQX98_004550 [Neonectria punicea]|uniref:Uncharacterized protein n=1 Tax=Neonectria punicea TaxID=979145 RepID=A0ABR1H8R9_9HYPO
MQYFRVLFRSWLVRNRHSSASSSLEESVLSTYTPCGDCPSGVGLAPVHVTAQYQELKVCHKTASVNTASSSATGAVGFACDDAPATFVSKGIPVAATDGFYTTTLVTDAEQIITISCSRTTHTSTMEPVLPTPAPNATNYRRASVPVVDIIKFFYTAPFNELGQHAIPNYAGSGLYPVSTCCPDAKGHYLQPVHVKECHNGNCRVYSAIWTFIPTHTTATFVAHGTTRTYTYSVADWHAEKPSSDPDPDTEAAANEHRAELVPKRAVAGRPVHGGQVMRRAGRFLNPSMEKLDKKAKRAINIQL